jgi:hypothetical protein
MNRLTRSTIVGLIASASIVAGCSSGAASSAASGLLGGAGASVAPAGGGDGATGSVAPTGGQSATCNQLTLAEVQPLLDVPLKAVQVQAFGLDGSGQECRFVGDDPANFVDVLVVGGDAGTQQYQGDIAEFASPAPLAGVGDQATRDANNESAAFAALKGSVYCSVSVEAEDVPGVGALMDAANNTNNIGEANYVIVTNALATVCNRIYGSGSTTIDLSGLKAAASAAP